MGKDRGKEERREKKKEGGGKEKEKKKRGRRQEKKGWRKTGRGKGSMLSCRKVGDVGLFNVTGLPFVPALLPQLPEYRSQFLTLLGTKDTFKLLPSAAILEP